MNRPAAVCRSAGALVVAVVLALTLGDSAGIGRADPASDALARLTELSREAEQTTEAVYSAELDLEAKLAAQRTAEDRQRSELEAMTVARANLAEYQTAVNQVAAASYMGGSTSTISAALNAESPQRLLDDLSASKVMAAQMSDRIKAFRAASARADDAARAAQSSALAARTAAEQASAVRAGLQSKQSRLRTQIAEVEALYRALTPDQRAALADPGPVPPAPPAPPAANPAIMALPEAIAPAGPGPSNAPGGAAVVQAALTRVGAPYSWGATGPMRSTARGSSSGRSCRTASRCRDLVRRWRRAENPWRRPKCSPATSSLSTRTPRTRASTLAMGTWCMPRRTALR